MKTFTTFSAESTRGAIFNFEVKNNDVLFNAPDGAVFSVLGLNGFVSDKTFNMLNSEKKAKLVLKNEQDAWLLNAMIQAARKGALLVSHSIYEKSPENTGKRFNSNGHYDDDEVCYCYLYSN